MLRRALLILLAVTALLVVSVLGVFGAANTGWGRAQIATLIEDATAGGPVAVRIGAIEGRLPDRIVLRDVSAGDGDGEFARIGELVLDWRLLDLAFGRVAITAVEISNASLDRPPVLPDGPTEAEPAPAEPLSLQFSPPGIAVSLDRLSIDALTLGAAVAGETVTVTADLSAALTADAASARGWVEAARESGPPARAEIDAALAPASGVLRAELSLRESKGGLVAELLAVEDRPPLALSLSGEGNVEDWRGRLQGGFGADAGIGLDLMVAADAGGYRLGIDGSATVARLAPNGLRSLLAAPATLRITVHARPDGSINLDTLSVALPSARLTASAATDPAGTPVAARLALDVPDLTPFQDLAGTALAGGVTLSADLEEDGRRLAVRVAGDPATAGIALNELTLDLTAEADRALASLPETLRFSIAGDTATPMLEGIDVPGLLGPRVSLSATGTLAPDSLDATVDRLAIAADGVRVDGSAALSGGARLTPVLAVTLPDLARLRDLAGLNLDGAARVDLDGTVALDPLSVTATLAVTGDGLTIGDPALDDLVGPGPTLLTGVTLDAERRLDLLGLELVVAAARAAGDLSLALEDGSIGGRLDLSAADLSILAPLAGTELAGRAVVAANLGGTLEAPAAAASWRVSGLRAAGTAVDEITGSATVAGLPASPAGDFATRAVMGRRPIDLAFAYGLGGDQLRVSGLRLDGLGASAAGDLALDLASTLAEGSLSLRADDLATVATAFDLPISAGTLNGEVGLTADQGQGAEVAVSLDGLTLDDGTSLDNARLTAALSDLTGAMNGRADLSLNGAATGGARVDSATLGAEITDGIARVALEASGDAGMAISLASTATVPLDPASAPIVIDRLDADLGDAALRQASPLTITLAPSPRIEGIDLAVDDGRISGHAGLDTADFDIALAIRALPVALARLADPTLRLAGRIAGDIRVTGPIDNPDADITLSTSGVRTLDPDLAEIPPLVADIALRLAQRRASARVEAAIGDGATTTVIAALEGRSAGAGSPPVFDDTTPLDASVSADLDLARVSAFLPLDLIAIAGTGAARVSATGTLGDPTLAGTVTVDDGRLDMPGAGVYLRDTTLRAEGAGQDLVIRRFETKAAGGGTLTASGSLSADAADGFPIDVTASARNFNISDQDTASVFVDLDLTASGALPEYLLAGTITVLPTRIQIPETLPPSVVEIDVVEVRDGRIVGATREDDPADEEASAPLRLDLIIDVPGQVFVAGRGLESEWGGQLAVTGLADAPVVEGEIAVRRGEFRAVGKTFAFERGRVVFDGGSAGDPGLDMRLVTAVTDIQAAVVVAGRASAPEISLESDPSLPEEDILSRLLFGSDKAELTPVQALKLARSAAILSGNFGSGPGITDQVRDTLGVDTLDVDTSTNDDGSVGASLSVGKYIAPGVFLKLQQGLSGATSRAVVEVELTDTISVETDVGADSQSRVGVNYELDY